MIASAAPIAVASNVARIVLTAVIYQLPPLWPSLIDLDTAAEVIHQWAGYMMMPIGLLLLLAEMSLLNKLMIAPAEHALVTARILRRDGATERVLQVRKRRVRS